jgi:hypothetical protein
VSTQSYAVLLLQPGYDTIDYKARHDRRAADAFLKAINHNRHTYSRELDAHNRDEGCDSDLVVFANETGVIALNADLAIDIAIGGSKAKRAASASGKLLAVAYNDQCLVDVFSYYERGELLRFVKEMDGDKRSDVSLVGNLLEEEIQAIREATPDLECDPDELSEFIVNGKAYLVEGFLPMRGAGLEVSKRMIGIELDSLNLELGSVYAKKPWWQFW